MEEGSWEKKLLNFDLMEMYDEVAAVPISPSEVITLCSALQCKVNLRRGNIVYAVEKKYKEKLQKCNQKNRLHWLNKNLKKIVPNFEEKFLKWQHKYNKNKRTYWLQRKLIALDYFTTLPSIVDDACLPTTIQQGDRRKSQYNQCGSQSVRIASLEASNCSTAGNISSASMQTVIASQPKNTQASSFNAMICFDKISESDCSSDSDTISLPQLIENQDFPIGNEAESTHEDVRKPEIPRKRILSLLQESQGILSEEMEYSVFHQDKLVTSTQKFGDDD